MTGTPHRLASLATSPQRGDEPKLEKHRHPGSISSPRWGEVARRAGEGWHEAPPRNEKTRRLPAGFFFHQPEG